MSNLRGRGRSPRRGLVLMRPIGVSYTMVMAVVATVRPEKPAQSPQYGAGGGGAA